MKSIDTKDLIRGDKIDLAEKVTEACGFAKSLLCLLKSHQTWMRARIEGRVVKKRTRGGKAGAKNLGTTVLEALSEAQSKFSISCPAWILAAKTALEVGDLTAEDDYRGALDLITTEKVTSTLNVGPEAARPWIERWASDIMLSVLKTKDVSATKHEMNNVLTCLATDLYASTEILAQRRAMMLALVLPEKCARTRH